MIVLDHEALAKEKPKGYRKDYLKLYFSMYGTKAVVSNEVWEAFRKRVIKDNSQEIAEEILAIYRGIVRPETIKIDDDFNEKEPTKDYTDEELIESTKDLIERNSLEIDYFICDDKSKYNNEVYTLEVEEFYYHCMGEHNLRADYDIIMGRKED